MKWYLIVVLIDVCLVSNDFEHLFKCFWAICKFSLEKCHLYTLPIKKKLNWSFYCWVLILLYVFEYTVDIIFKYLQDGIFLLFGFSFFFLVSWYWGLMYARHYHTTEAPSTTELCSQLYCLDFLTVKRMVTKGY